MPTSTHTHAADAMPTIRKRRFDFSGVPKYWYAKSAVATHISNGVNMLFPAGERFFVRSVRHYLDLIQDDPELVAQVRGFFGQEGAHAREHDRFNEFLTEQGFEVAPFLKQYEASMRFIEKLAPPALRLSATAATEHFTAVMAHNAFDDALFEQADDRMRELLLWHAAEEIEHKAVAFDVLQRVNPSYSLRMAGMAIACALLSFYWAWGTATLLKQDGLTFADLRRDLDTLRTSVEGGASRSIAKDVFWKAIVTYLPRDFHPWDVDDYELATAFLDRDAVTASAA